MKRGVFKLFVFLALGAVVNVAVAWGCLRWQQGPRSVEPPADAEELWARYSDPSSLHSRVQMIKCHGGLGCDWITLRADAPQPSDDQRPEPTFMRITRAGLLMRAFESMDSWGAHAPGDRGGIPVRPFNTNLAWVSALPYRPIPVAFTVNTLLFACLLFSGWALSVAFVRGMGRLRAELRQQRGRCPQCSYDLLGNLIFGCPECGWNRSEGEA